MSHSPRAASLSGASLSRAAAIACILALLLGHAAIYWFQTDDAFISFRYARNLRSGAGLVFNPGLERVEGYTNFLWVVLLAGFDAAGLRPERAADLLSLAATAALFAMVVWFAGRRPAPPGMPWLSLVPALLLATNRSFAVWTSSGLETRLFEALVLGGALRLVVEIEARVLGASAPRPFAAVLFALATLTRPDGLLIAAAALGAAALFLGVRGRPWLRDLLPSGVVFALPVSAHLAFRRLYYDAWLPNTYFAKVDGKTWWSMGWCYLGAFLLEYAACLWIPLLVAAVLHHLRARTGHVPLVFLSIAAAQTLYIVSIGGDHFEYRPLDLCFPFVFLLLADGARRVAPRPRGAVVAAALLALVAAGQVVLPWETHRQFPQHYLSGFPGEERAEAERKDFLAPERGILTRLPAMSAATRAYQKLLRHMTGHFVGLRQEEHKLFLASVVPEGRQLAHFLAEGALPHDAYFAISCVGAIPYYSDLRVLDRLGLTDAHVAHLPIVAHQVMAHEKQASLDYARERQVDFWAVDPVHSLWRTTDFPFLDHLDRVARGFQEAHVAEVGEGWYLLGILPEGAERARARFPRLEFRKVNDREATRPIFEAARRAFGDRARSHPGDRTAQLEYARVLLYAGALDEAIAAFAPLRTGRDAEPDLYLARAYWEKEKRPEALAALREALRIDPESPAALRAMGIALGASGQEREAVDWLRRAARLRPSDPGIRLSLAEACLALGEVDAARREYQVLRGMDPAAAATLQDRLRR